MRSNSPSAAGRSEIRDARHPLGEGRLIERSEKVVCHGSERRRVKLAVDLTGTEHPRVEPSIGAVEVRLHLSRREDALFSGALRQFWRDPGVYDSTRRPGHGVRCHPQLSATRREDRNRRPEVRARLDGQRARFARWAAAPGHGLRPRSVGSKHVFEQWRRQLEHTLTAHALPDQTQPTACPGDKRVELQTGSELVIRSWLT